MPIVGVSYNDIAYDTIS